MASKKNGPAEKVPTPPGGRGKGLEKFLASLEPRQVEALRREADRRRPDLKARPDVSSLLREAVDDWLAKNAKR